MIRVAVESDADEIRAVFRRSSLSNAGDRPALVANPDALEWSDLPVREQRTRVAIVDGRIVGFATMRPVGEVLELEDIFVDPDWMRRGVGRALMADAVAIGRGRGAARIEVTANHHAAAFYEELGFVYDTQTETRFGPAPRMHRPIT